MISAKRGNLFLMCLNNNYQCISALETCRGMSLRYGVALYGGVGGKEKNSHRFFGIFIRLNLCEINGLLFEPCLAFSNI